VTFSTESQAASLDGSNNNEDFAYEGTVQKMVDDAGDFVMVDMEDDDSKEPPDENTDERDKDKDEHENLEDNQPCFPGDHKIP
jgi:hypothetical protein